LAKLKDAEKDHLRAFIPKFIQNHEQADKIEFLPHFTTFLNQKRFNDELPYKLKPVLIPQTTVKPVKASLNDE
jgi:hypothetical protein